LKAHNSIAANDDHVGSIDNAVAIQVNDWDDWGLPDVRPTESTWSIRSGKVAEV